MSEYCATIQWTRKEGEEYIDNQYSRAHSWSFDGGITIQASSSPQIVPTPYSVEENVDPEEAFIASLSSCHMLFFLSLAAKRKLIIDAYLDHVTGVLKKDRHGKASITKVTLNPQIKFSGKILPTTEQITKIHNEAHEQCFIANSVKSEIEIIPWHCLLTAKPTLTD